MTVSLNTIRDHVHDILSTTTEPPEQVYLFGSHARDEATPESDIDIALIDDSFESIPFHERGRWFKKEWDYLEIGPLELLCLTPEEYQHRIEEGQSTATNIGNEGILLSE